jgi:hypothetical protein
VLHQSRICLPRLNADLLNSIGAHTFFLNKIALYNFSRKVHLKQFKSFSSKFWHMIFDMFVARGVKTDQGFSEALVDYLNKYIFYFQDYIANELGDYRLDFSKLNKVPTTELVLKSRLL